MWIIDSNRRLINLGNEYLLHYTFVLTVFLVFVVTIEFYQTAVCVWFLMKERVVFKENFYFHVVRQGKFSFISCSIPILVHFQLYLSQSLSTLATKSPINVKWLFVHIIFWCFRAWTWTTFRSLLLYLSIKNVSLYTVIVCRHSESLLLWMTRFPIMLSSCLFLFYNC